MSSSRAEKLGHDSVNIRCFVPERLAAVKRRLTRELWRCHGVPLGGELCPVCDGLVGELCQCHGVPLGGELCQSVTGW